VQKIALKKTRIVSAFKL